MLHRPVPETGSTLIAQAQRHKWKPSRAKSKYTVHPDSAQTTPCTHHQTTDPADRTAATARHVQLSVPAWSSQPAAHLVIIGPAREGVAVSVFPSRYRGLEGVHRKRK